MITITTLALITAVVTTGLSSLLFKWPGFIGSVTGHFLWFFVLKPLWGL